MTIEMHEIEKLLERISTGEKALVPQWVARDLGEASPGIEFHEGIAGGAACIIRTRIPVWLIDQARRLGTSEADILQAYPTISAEDLINAKSYARTHKMEMDSQIAETNWMSIKWQVSMRLRTLLTLLGWNTASRQVANF